MDKNNSLYSHMSFKRFYNYGLITLFCLLLMIIFMSLAFSIDAGFVLLYMPIVTPLIALLGVFFWWKNIEMDLKRF